MSPITGVGIDFGTTNSVLAFAHADGRVESRTWPTAAGPTATFRTALTFWREGRAVHHAAGPAAIARAAAPVGDQRFVQSLKTHLASRSFSETRLYGARYTIEALVALFLRDLAGPDLADRDLVGKEPLAAPMVGGRPVVFAGADPNEALALSRLSAGYEQAGLHDVAFAFEPLGAAYWYARDLASDETVLVADFGGGTSDFSLLRFSREGGRLRSTALAHAGVGIAGDTFDYRIIDHAVAPLIGKGATYASFGKQLPIPAYVHASFSQWHQLSWLKSGNTLAELRKLAEASTRRSELEALVTIIEMDLGLALYQAVGTLKAALSTSDEATLEFDHEGIVLTTTVTRREFEEWIAADLATIDGALAEVLRRGGVPASAIDAVFVTGGTSFVPAVRRLFDRRFPTERIHQGDAFQSVASGLALMAADRGVRLDGRRVAALA